jgi:transcriptional regulator with XRE-family HTH domain
VGANRKSAVRGQHRPAYRGLCDLLREWRASAGLTQRDLAELLGKPRSFVSKSETAERRIDPLEFVVWYRACGIDPAVAIRKLERLV